MFFRGLLLFALGAGLLALASWVCAPSHVTGDGFEYITVSEALLHHASPNVRTKDVESLISRSAPGDVYAPLGHRFLAGSDGNQDFGFFRARNGRLYGYHFWLYSLVNAPALAICQLFGWSPGASFLLTNAAIFLGLIALIAWLAPWNGRRKAVLIALALGCGSTFYLAWSGPETMCFCLVMAGLILLADRRHGWALLAFAAAAQQAPPIGLLAVLTGVLACWRAFQAWRTEGWNGDIAKRLAVLVPGALLLFASPLFYLARFGVPNLIIKSGGSDATLISAGRLIGLLFDLNQGMVLGMPGLFVVLPLLVVIGLCRPARRPAWLALGLIAVTLLMALPALSGPNWNAGEVVIMRYGYWLSAPLLYACALLLDALAGVVLLWICLAVLLIGQAVVMAIFGIVGANYNYVHMTPIASWVLDRHPRWYAPAPEIFAERGLQREGVFQPGFSFFNVYQKRITTVLTHNPDRFVLDAFCHGGNNTAAHPVELGWRYFYPLGACPIDWADGIYGLPDPPPMLEPAVLNSLNAGTPYLSGVLPGFRDIENWGTWTTGRVARLPLSLPVQVGGLAVTRWRITLTFNLYLHPPQIPMQHVMVYAGQTQVLDLTTRNGSRADHSFVVDVTPWGDHQAFVILTLRIPTATSPKEAGISNDTRRMGMGLISLRADPL